MLLIYPDLSKLETTTRQMRCPSTLRPMTAGLASITKSMTLQSSSKRTFIWRLVSLWLRQLELTFLTGSTSTHANQKWPLIQRPTWTGTTAQWADTCISHHLCPIATGIQPASKLHGGEIWPSASVDWARKQGKLEFLISWPRRMMFLKFAQRRQWTRSSTDTWSSTNTLQVTLGRD